MNLTVIEEPPFEPITLRDCYQHLRLDPTDSPLSHPDDEMLQRMIVSARKHVEHLAGRALIQQVLRLSGCSFPSKIRLLRPPIIRVENVSYYDGDNFQQDVDLADWYQTDGNEVLFVTGWSAPTAYSRPDAVRVDYVAGYVPAGSPATTQEEYAAAVPAPLKDAILLQVQLLYDNLSSENRAALERTRDALISGYRVYHV